VSATLVGTAPRGPLAALVAGLWLFEGPPAPHARDRMLPTGEAELVLDLRPDGPGAIVSGPSTRPWELSTRAQTAALGVAFRPGGAAALLGLPVAALRDERVDLDALWPCGAAEALLHAVLGARGPAARLAAAEHALAARLAQVDRPPHPAARRAVARIAAAPERVRVGALADELGLSTRRLEQVLRADVGLAPKPLARLLRFRRALARLHEAEGVGWAAFALERGFADQSHLIAEVRAHAGMTPPALLAARGPHLNHVALPPAP
jgi:AraC-like DNA-binding protein